MDDSWGEDASGHGTGMAEEQGSWGSTGSNIATIKGLVGGLVDLSLEGGSGGAPVDSQQTMDTIRPAALLVSINAGRGTVTRLGYTPTAVTAGTAAVEEWDDDLPLTPGTAHPALLPLSRPLLPTSIETDAIDDEFDESDFELPANLSHMTLSPLISRAPTPDNQPRPTTLFPPLPLRDPLISSPSLSAMADSSLSDQSTEEDDESFFEELVLPAYFLGGPGPLTPPSDSEMRGRNGRVDLQAMLRRRLEARGRAEEESQGQATRVVSTKLQSYKEGTEEAGGEHGLVIGEGEVAEERMRTRSRSVATLPSQSTRLPFSTSSVARASSSRNPTTPRQGSVSTIPLRPSFLPPTHRPSHSSPSLPASRYTSSSSYTPVTTHIQPPTPESSASRPTLPPPAPSTPLSSRLRPKHSIANLRTPGVERVRTLSHQRSLQSLSPSRVELGDDTPRATRSLGFAGPTAASSARTRERTGGIPLMPGTTSSRASLPRSFHPVQPTSPRKQARTIVRPAGLEQMKVGNVYGDGNELDAFEDLPTNGTREKAVVLPSARVVGKGGMTMGTTRGGGMVTPGNRTRVGIKRSNDSAGLGVGSVERNKPIKIRVRKQPQLIKSQGFTHQPQVQDGMTWNPTLQQWDGNSHSLSAFDIISTSRPSLITPLSLPTFPPSPISYIGGKGSKKVGGMTFDPVRMSWYASSSTSESILSFSSSDEEDDMDIEEDGWEKGERGRMLKNRASFVHSEEQGEEGEGVRGESERAERRCRVEMRGWKGREREEEREWLWDLRTLIVESQSPPRH